MKMPLRYIPLRSQRDWNGVDLAHDGTFVAASVSTLSGSRKPRVRACVRSSGVAMGTHALQELAGKLPRAGWCTVLARDDYRMLVLPEPPVLEAEVLSSLRWSLGSMIDYPVAEASIAWMRIPTAEYGATLEKRVYAVVARNTVVQERAQLFAGAGIGLQAVDVRETALRNIATLAQHPGEALALVSLSSAGVHTIFTFEGELYLDRFIAHPLDEPVADEQRRRRFLERLASQVGQSLELMAGTYPFFAVKRLLVAPSEYDMDVAHYLANALPITVERLDLSSLFDLSDVPELKARSAQGAFLVALGAALRGRK